MGSGVSAEALKNASAQEVKQVVADLPPESKQKLEEALTKTEKTSLAPWREICLGSDGPRSSEAFETFFGLPAGHFRETVWT